MIEFYFDGACRPWNPGGVASYGYVAFCKGKVISEGKGVVGPPGMPESTNNVAEYAAFVLGLEALRDVLGDEKEISVRGDSQLVLYQVAGRYAVNAEHLKGCHHKAVKIVRELREAGCAVELEWVPRGKNVHADLRSVEAGDEYLAKNPGALDEVVMSFGKHKGTKWRDVPAGYKGWLLAKM